MSCTVTPGIGMLSVRLTVLFSVLKFVGHLNEGVYNKYEYFIFICMNVLCFFCFFYLFYLFCFFYFFCDCLFFFFYHRLT